MVQSCRGSAGVGPCVGGFLGDVGEDGVEEGKRTVSSEGLLPEVVPTSNVGAIFAKPGVEVAEEEHGASMTKLEGKLGEGMPQLPNVHK